MIDRLFPYVLLFIGVSMIASLLMSCERIEPNQKRKSQIVMLAGV
jgi:hypothetical protein